MSFCLPGQRLERVAPAWNRGLQTILNPEKPSVEAGFGHYGYSGGQIGLKNLGHPLALCRNLRRIGFVAFTGGLGVAVSLDAVGTAVTRAQCITATRSAGTLILSGLHEEASNLPVAEVIRREIVLKGSFAYSPANFVEALELLARDEIRLDPWIVESALESGGQWFDRLIDAPGNVSKVLLHP